MTADILSLVTEFASRRHGKRGADSSRMPVQEDVRSRIIQLHEQGLGQTKIAAKLKEEDFRCEKTGKLHKINSVRKALKDHEKLKRATSTLTQENHDTLERFLKESCSFSGRVFTRPLFKEYPAWCIKNRIEPSSSRKMTSRLQQKFETETTKWGFMFVKGISLKGNRKASFNHLG